MGCFREIFKEQWLRYNGSALFNARVTLLQRTCSLVKHVRFRRALFVVRSASMSARRGFVVAGGAGGLVTEREERKADFRESELTGKWKWNIYDVQELLIYIYTYIYINIKWGNITSCHFIRRSCINLFLRWIVSGQQYMHHILYIYVCGMSYQFSRWDVVASLLRRRQLPVYPTWLIRFLMMTWWREQPRHQQL